MTFSYSNNRSDIRNLANLVDSGSTNRALNLWSVAKLHSYESEYREKLFFSNININKSIVLKHTIRKHERELFRNPRKTATKIIIPFDVSDLRLGGQSIFIGQKGFETFVKHFYTDLGICSVRDMIVFSALDELPSLDPFLVREYLGRRDIRPATCYLKISPADISRMACFANSEIEDLVRTAFGTQFQSGAATFIDKILSDEIDNALEPLRQVLRLSVREFSEGIFSWRGFLYFKWSLIELKSRIDPVLKSIMSYKHVPSRDRSVNEYINKTRPGIIRNVYRAVSASSRTLSVYNRAYKGLVDEKNPSLFRRFLLDGPSLFFELGENLGILHHISSYWSYRIAEKSRSTRMRAEEFADLLFELEISLAGVSMTEGTSSGLVH